MGFDEKFAVRFLLRHKIHQNDVIILITTEGYKTNSKIITAINTLRNLTNSWVDKDHFVILTVDLKKNFLEWAKSIHDVLDSYEPESIKALLSGGMRAIIIMTFVALQKYTKSRTINIEIDFENLESYIKIPLHVLRLEKSIEFLKILKVVQENPGISIREIARRMDISAPTISRKVKELKRLGLLVPDNSLIISKDGEFYIDYFEL